MLGQQGSEVAATGGSGRRRHNPGVVGWDRFGCVGGGFGLAEEAAAGDSETDGERQCGRCASLAEVRSATASLKMHAQERKTLRVS